jgi:hypothetical protein
MLFSLSCIVLIVYIPVFNLYFHTAPLAPIDWLLPILSGIICMIVFEIRKVAGNHEKAHLSTIMAHGHTSLAKEPQKEILKHHSK